MTRIQYPYGLRKIGIGMVLATAIVAVGSGFIMPAAGQPTPSLSSSIRPGPDYDLSWYTIDGGGVMFSTDAGGEYELSGTIGQPDAGGPMTGGEFELTGGFWVLTAGCVVESVLAPHCSIDARQPFNPDGGSPDGWSSFDFNFAEGCDVSAVGPGDFVSPIPIDDVVVEGNTVTLYLSGSIPAGDWTCIEHLASATTACWGWLPADANGDGTSSPADIDAVIDNLQGLVEPPLEAWQCDVDHTGRCNPADILRVIDLLNGADQYEPWNAQSIDTCPATGP